MLQNAFQLVNFTLANISGFEEDSYLGSGEKLSALIQKYGVESFRRKIYKIVETQKELDDLEKRCIEKYASHPLCLNLKTGGRNAKKTLLGNSEIKEYKVKEMKLEKTISINKNVMKKLKFQYTLNNLGEVCCNQNGKLKKLKFTLINDEPYIYLFSASAPWNLPRYDKSWTDAQKSTYARIFL